MLCDIYTSEKFLWQEMTAKGGAATSADSVVIESEMHSKGTSRRRPRDRPRQWHSLAMVLPGSDLRNGTQGPSDKGGGPEWKEETFTLIICDSRSVPASLYFLSSILHEVFTIHELPVTRSQIRYPREQ